MPVLPALRASLGALALVAVTALPAAADLVRVASPHDPATTADRLAAAVEGAGATVFARIDHAAGAASVGETIPANLLVIFGNPAIGTPAIRDAPSAGLDLPLRVLVVEEGAGSALVYRAPADLAAAHGLPADHPAIAKMAGALAALTGKAAAAE